MGNSLNCTSGRSARHSKRGKPSTIIDDKGTFINYMDAEHPVTSSVAPDVLPIEAANFARERRFSKRSAGGSTPSSPKPTNNNDRPEAFTFETAFRLSQLQSSTPMVTIPITPTENGTSLTSSTSKPTNNSENCYVNIKPFIFPLPPVPSDQENTNNSHGSGASGGELTPPTIPQEEITPPTARRQSTRLSIIADMEEAESPRLPPRPTRLTLTSQLSNALQLHDSLSDESAAKSPPPRKVLFSDSLPYADTGGCELQPSDQCRLSVPPPSTPEPETLSPVVKKRPKKPPRNYSYKASTLPKRISHTTEEVMELWDEVRKALSLEKIQDTTSLHISEEDDDDIDEIYQNLYAARMRSWQIMCLAQDILVERLKPDRVWECFLSESLVNEAEYGSLNVGQCSRRESSQLIIDRILEHGDGWFDRLRELLRIHEDQKQVSNLLEALNDVFIIGAKANKWTFSLTTKHCTVQQARPRSLSDHPDLIGDTIDALQPILLLEVYDENFGNSSCTALGEVLRKYNVISQLNLGKNKLTAKGIARLSTGIEGNRCLEKLNLRLNPLENEGLEILTKAMERNGSVKELILCHTHLQAGAGESLSRLLSYNSSVEVLDLSYNELTDADCEELMYGLQQNQTLQTLNLRGNQITPRGCEHLATALRANMTMHTLDISHNMITNKGLSYFSHIIQSHDNLRELHFENCGLTHESCKLLSAALSTNHSLAALYLSNNNIGDEGCEHLADMLTANNALQTLYLNLCSINRAGLHRILTVISHDNFSLRTLGVCYNNIEINNDDVVQDGFEAVDIRSVLNRALENNTDRKILTWGKALS